MRRFILRENIRRFEAMLEAEADPSRRETLSRFLSEARHELSRLEQIWLWTCPGGGVPDEIGMAVESALDAIIERADAQFGSVQLWNDNTQALHLLAHRNFAAPLAEQFAFVRVGAGTVYEAALAKRAAVIVEDVESDVQFKSVLSWTRPCGVRAIHTSPIFGNGGRFVGAFSTFYSTARILDAAQKNCFSTSADYLSELLQKIH